MTTQPPSSPTARPGHEPDVPTGTGPAAIDAGTAAQGAALLERMERIPLTRFHLRIATILGVGTFFDSFDALAISVTLTAILQSFGAPLSVAGVLIAAGFFGQIIGAIGFGVVSERYGRKTAFIAASAVFGALSIAAAFAWSVESLLVLRLLQGIGLGAEVPVAAAMFNEFVRAKARGKIVMIYESLFVWGILGATLIGALFLAVFSPHDAWRYLFAVGGIPLLTAVWAYFRLPESPRHLVHRGDIADARAVVEQMEASARRGGHDLAAPSDAPHLSAALVAEPRTRFQELFAKSYRRRTIVLWIMWFTTFLPLGGFTTWMPTLLIRIGKLPPATASLLTGAIVVGDLVVLYLAAASLDRLGRRFWFTVGYALALGGGIFGALAILLGWTGWVPLFIAGALVLFGVNINAPILYLYTAELYPTRMRAWATMVTSTMRNLGSVIAPITIGVLVSAATGILWTFLLVIAVLLIGLLVMLRFGIETKQRALEELAH